MTVNGQVSKNTKWLLIGLGGAALFFACSLLTAFLVIRQITTGYQDRINFRPTPEDASLAAHKMIDYDLPPAYHEVQPADFPDFSTVQIAPDSNVGPLILLAQYDPPLIKQDARKEEIRAALKQQSGRQDLNLELVKVEMTTIRGEQVETRTYEGRNQVKLVIREFVATFPGKDGTIMMMIICPVGLWDQEIVDDFIESIH